MKKETFPYDNEELELLEAIEKGEWRDVPLSDQDKDTYAQHAAYTKALHAKRQVTIRFAVRDLAIIKARAKELGIGYQNLIQALVHNYVEGKCELKL